MIDRIARCILLLAFVSFFAYALYMRGHVNNSYYEALALIERQNYEQAIPILEQIASGGTYKDVDRLLREARRNIGVCPMCGHDGSELE